MWNLTTFESKDKQTKLKFEGHKEKISAKPKTRRTKKALSLNNNSNETSVRYMGFQISVKSNAEELSRCVTLLENKKVVSAKGFGRV